MVLRKITYLAPVLNWTEVGIRVSVCTTRKARKKITSERLGRRADRNSPIPHVIHASCQINKTTTFALVSRFICRTRGTRLAWTRGVFEPVVFHRLRVARERLELWVATTLFRRGMTRYLVRDGDLVSRREKIKMLTERIVMGACTDKSKYLLAFLRGHARYPSRRAAPTG